MALCLCHGAVLLGKRTDIIRPTRYHPQKVRAMGIHFPVNHKLYRLLFVMIAYGMVLIGAIAGCGSPHVSQMSIHSPLPRALPQQQTDLDTNRTFTSPTFESPLEMTGAPQIETQELFIHNTVSSATSLAFDDYYLYFNSNAGLLCRTPPCRG